MKVIKSLTSVARGALWLVRANGLREQVKELRSVLDLHRRWTSGDLRAFERSVYSQNGEDGIIREILRRIGVKHRLFVEFGVETGKECNCARLVRHEQWSGVFLEADDDKFSKLEKNYTTYEKVRCRHAVVSSQNIEQLLAAENVPEDFDVLSIDIDGNDYWVWKAIERWQPRLVVIEYNAAYAPPIKWVMEENFDHHWDGTNYYGASLTSLTQLGNAKGYTLVATDSRGINAFFVRSELVERDKFLDPTLFYHYSPLDHPALPRGHPPGFGPFVEI